MSAPPKIECRFNEKAPRGKSFSVITGEILGSGTRDES
jgi:hypothetical protein